MKLIVNMFGPPGSGKSTTATGLFYLMKLAGKNVEYVPEVAKALTYEERHRTLNCQAYIHGKQLRDLQRLHGKVDIAVTDSPTLLSYIYGKRYGNYPDSFYQFVVDQFKLMPSINFLIERTKIYNPSGRNQTESESNEIGNEIKLMLDSLEIPYISVQGDAEAPTKIMEHLKSFT